jgi:hypothetical protein
VRISIICRVFLLQILLGWSNEGGLYGRGMHHAWGRWEISTKFYVGEPQRKRPLGAIGVDFKLKCNTSKLGATLWTGLIWLRIRTCGGIFWTR